MPPKTVAPKEPEFAIEYRKCTADVETEVAETKKIFEEIRKLNALIMAKLNPESKKNDGSANAQASNK